MEKDLDHEVPWKQCDNFVTVSREGLIQALTEAMDSGQSTSGHGQLLKILTKTLNC